MPEHRRRRLAFIKTFGRDLYSAYVVHATAACFPDYAIFQVYGEDKNHRRKKLRFCTIRSAFYRNQSMYFVRNALTQFPDRQTLIQHMNDHAYAFGYIPQK